MSNFRQVKMAFKSFIVLAAIIFAVPPRAYSQLAEPASQPVTIQSFSAPDGGEQVTNSLPIYKVHVVNGELVDDAGNVFNSYRPQTTTPSSDSNCVIRNLNWAAYNTTFYVVLENDQSHMLLVKSCGKSPLQLNSTEQYPGITRNNFINHAQIAGKTGNTVNRVIAAGEIDIIDGKIVYMDTCSGHFKPNAGSLLAYMSSLDGNKSVALTSQLKTIIGTGVITSGQIATNLTFMKDDGNIVPKRNVRSGTSNCQSYTTVFLYSKENGTTTLTGGLMAYQQGNINIFQNDINTITNKNIKGIKLTSNTGIYSYSAYVTTEWHVYNNYMNFAFTDETDDTYTLSIHVYSYNHEVDFNSTSPNIKKITFY